MKILYIGNQLSKHGLNKTTIETLGPNLEKEGIEVFYASNKRIFLFRMLDMLFTLFKSRNRVSYVLIDTYSTKAFWYAFFCGYMSNFFNIKYIPILHGGDLPNRLQLNPKISKILFANAYKNVAPSGYLKKIFEENGFNNVIHIPNAIEVDSYAFKSRTHFAPKLLWVRSFAKIYNPEMAINVLFEIKKTYPNATLTMVGPDKDGSLESTKKYAQELSLEVNFTGKLSKEEWLELAANFDFFINTTHFDNTPVSVMEAMALGLPVISTNVGGIPYLLANEKTAILVNDNNHNQMATAITDLVLDNKKASQISETGRKFIEQMDWELVKLKWISILQ